MTRTFACVAALLALSAPAFGAHQEGRGLPVDRDAYPYYPTLLRWERSAAPFTAPEVCGACHPDQYTEWKGSMHAFAFRDPVYQGELNKAVRAIGHENARNCEGCHSPAGVATGEIQGAGLVGLGPVAVAGVSCDVCHSVSGVSHWDTPTHAPENASLVLSPGHDTKDEPVLVKRGPMPPSEECGGGFHECQESPLHRESDLCASCHQSTHFEAHSPLGNTYLEWKQSPYAQNGIHCQDCHMVDTASFLQAADDFRKPSREQYRHYFNGANFLLYSLGAAAAEQAGDEALAASLRAQYDMAVARLQAAAELELSPVYRAGQLAEVKVRVRNLRAGHGLPTHLTNIRQMWLEVTATDAAGQVLLSSGTLDAAGRLAPESRTFGTVGVDLDGRPAVDPWAVRSLVRNDTVPPKGYRDVHFGLPAATREGPVLLRARLRYRQAEPEVVGEILANLPDDIGLPAGYGNAGSSELPVLDMAVQEAAFPDRK